MMMMMKKPVILVACVLMLSSLAVLASQSGSGPSECCFKFYTKRLPKDKVMSYKYVDPRCAKRSVIFVMKKGGEFCVDPSVQWVKNIIEDRDWTHNKLVNSTNSTESG
uniref:chemokine (C-C motif) ligand 38, duplicate 4 n=1 Tax=Scatophagus argus TaxID=75038 RepID=UPI001ED82AA2|nr:chemokine (C-C motif) ligand 38, duplicate 4 [Scatophagus argus]